ncbi:hypothetical protein LG296_01665 [Ureibacillus chungkukjangi]|uniref:hypothetical protein n=1 Tax=Ureibacillus chungkukjangi TaxID=1202712 RepID=UPI00384AC7F7
MSKNETIRERSKATAEQVGKAISNKVETVIYCGPTLNNGELSQYAVFQGELPQRVNKHIKAELAVGELLIPVKDLAVVKSKIQQKGTREHLLFERALKYAKGGNK